MSAFGRVFGVLLRRRSPAGEATAWAIALITPPVIAAATESARASLGLAGFLFCALLVVVLVALVGGRRPALAAVACGLLAGDYVFAKPYNSFSLHLRAADAALVVFVAVGAAVAVLVDQLARLLEEQTSLRRVESAVRRVATLVAQAASAQELFAAATREVGGLFAIDLAGMGRFETDGTVTVLAGWRGDGVQLPVGSRTAVEDGNLSALVAATGRPARIDSPSDASGSVGALLREAGIRSAVAVPITVQARLWGVMMAGSTGEKPLPASTEAQLADFTELLATAVSNAESNAWLTRLAEEQAALRRVATLVAGGAPPEEVFAAVAEEVVRLFGTYSAIMGRYGPDGTFVSVARYGGPAEHLPVGSRHALGGNNLATIVFDTGRPARVDDYAESAGGPLGAAAREVNLRSSVATPIMVEGRLWGLIAAGSTRDTPLPADTEARLASFTELLATAVANAESSARLATLAREQAALRRVATLVARGVPAAELFTAVAEEVGLLLSLEYVHLIRYEPDDTATSLAAFGRSEDVLPAGTRLELGGRNVTTLVFETGRAARIDGYGDASGPFAEVARERDARLRASLGTPIVVEATVWGVVVVGTSDEQSLPVDTEARLASFTELLATAIANTESRARLAELAEEQAALRRVATLVARGVPAGELFTGVTEEVARLFPTDWTVMCRYLPGDAFTIVGSVGSLGKPWPIGSRWPLGGNNAATLVFEMGRPARIENYAGVSGAHIDRAREDGIRSTVGTPIVVEGRVWGLMAVVTIREEPLPADTEARLSSFTELVGTAVANAESRAGLGRLAEEQEALRRVATLVARGVPPEEVFASVIDEVARRFLSDGAALARFESDGTFTIAASAGELFTVGSRWPIGGENVATAVLATSRPARIDNLIATGPLAEQIRAAGVRSSVGTPIIVEGHVWGVIGVVSTREALPPDTEARLAGFTELVATAIANADSRANLARLADEQAALRRVATLVARGVPPEEVFASVTEEAERLLGCDVANLTRFESDRTFTILASQHERFPVGSRWPIGGKNVTTLVFETGRPARIDDFFYTGPLADDIRGEIRSAVGSPILVEDRLWGAIGVGSFGEQRLHTDTEQRLQAFTELVATAIANAQSRAALRPVERMRSQAERITDRQLSERLPVSDDPGEVTALGRTLNAMLDRVEEAVARERRVVSDASHELRTPLTTLRAEVDLALMGDRDKSELREALESASEEAKRMSRLADDLLVLARADQGRLPLHPQQLAARELLEAGARRAHAGVEVGGRSIAVAEPAEDYAVRADPDRAAQALDNLITNALLYGKGAITLSAHSEDGYVEVHVCDEGSGFPDELLPRAFERFGRGQHARSNEPGSGLGLALVEAIALAHGGHAEARNRPGGGADVSFTLPRA